jgi:phage-related protein
LICIANVSLSENIAYLCGMKRTIITYGGYFERFIATLSTKELRKLNYIVSLLETEERLPTKFIKLIRNGLYELRMKFGDNIYRIFFIFDEGTVVVLFNGFQKKTEKTPPSEIERALKIKEAYYADKRPQY